jgi:iron-sulfur cluster repair protein YtfE (RIC family)
MGELRHCWLDKSFETTNEREVNFENEEILSYRKLTTPELVKVLKTAHHNFEYNRVPSILQTLNACYENYPNQQLVSSRMLHVFQMFFSDLLKHFKEEESGFFMYSEKLHKTVQQGFVKGSFLKESKMNSDVFTDHHQVIWDDFNQLLRLTKLYANRIGGMEVSVLQGQLEALKLDLEKHDSIESQVLVIKVLFLERNLKLML